MVSIRFDLKNILFYRTIIIAAAVYLNNNCRSNRSL